MRPQMRQYNPFYSFVFHQIVNPAGEASDCLIGKPGPPVRCLLHNPVAFLPFLSPEPTPPSKAGRPAPQTAPAAALYRPSSRTMEQCFPSIWSAISAASGFPN